MAKQKAKQKIPESAVAKALEKIKSLKDKRIHCEFKGKFLHIFTKEGLLLFKQLCPLCRFDYQGSDKKWGFAIYKYSRNIYSKKEFGFPTVGEIDECIKIALKAYNM